VKVLKGILNESKQYYMNIEKEIKVKLSKLPKGNIKKRKINGKIYFYLQERQNSKIIHKYLGKSYPEKIAKEIEEREKLKKELKEELKKVKEALKILNKTEGKKSVRNHKKNT